VGAALATNSHLQAVCEIIALDNHLIFFSFNAGKHAMHNLPPDSPIRAIPENLRRALGVAGGAS
jgi:hypothetical protein